MKSQRTKISLSYSHLEKSFNPGVPAAEALFSIRSFWFLIYERDPGDHLQGWQQQQKFHMLCKNVQDNFFLLLTVNLLSVPLKERFIYFY